MQYVRETFLYLKRVWNKLGLICLPAAVLLGFVNRPVSGITYLPAYATGNVNGFADILRLVAGEFTVKTIFPPFLIFIVLLLTFGFMFSFIEKHFRIGRTMLKKSFQEINNYFIPVLKIILIIGGFLLVYYLLMVSGVAFQHFLFSFGRTPPSVISVVIASLWSVILTAVLILLCSPLIFMVPLMQIYGYSFGDTFRSSLSYYGNNPLKITFGLAFGFIIATVIGAGLSILDLFILDWYWVKTVLWIVLHCFLLVYVGAYSMVTVFSVTGMERKDIKKYGF